MTGTRVLALGVFAFAIGADCTAWRIVCELNMQRRELDNLWRILDRVTPDELRRKIGGAP